MCIFYFSFFSLEQIVPTAKCTAEHADHGCLVLSLPLSGDTKVTWFKMRKATVNPSLKVTQTVLSDRTHE